MIRRYKKYLSSVSLYLLASLLKAIVSIVLNPFVALNMTHKDYAITGYFNSFAPLLVPFMSFSFFQYYTKNYYVFSEEKRKSMRQTIASSLLLLSGIELVIIFFIFYFYIQINKVGFPFFPYALLSFSTLFFNNFFQFKQVDLKMERKALSFLKINAWNTVVYLILTVLLVIFIKLGATGYLLAALITGILCGIYCFFDLTEGALVLDKEILRDALMFCWPLCLAASMNYFFGGIDILFLEKEGNVEMLGNYNIGLMFASYLALFQTAVTQTFQPDIFQAVAADNKRKIMKIAAGINLINAIPILLFILFASIIIQVLTAGRYMDSVQFAKILSLKNITATIYFSISSIIIAYGHSKITLVNKVLGMLLSVIIFKILIEYFGFVGAAWGRVLSFFCMSLISFSYLLYLWKRKEKKILP